jgi:acyl carrier protein
VSLEARVCRLVGDVLGQDVTVESSQDTVDNWDSVNIINMMVAFETEFGVTFTPEDAAEMLSVRVIVAALREKGVA